MKVFVIGGSGSGKSEWAEKKAIELSKGKSAIYVATMRPEGDEGRKRIRRHREARSRRNFITLELDCELKPLISYREKTDTVLVEDLSNLLSNLRYFRNMSFESALEKIKSEMELVERAFKNIVLVSNDIFSDGVDYPKETREYIENLARLNISFAAWADSFAEIVVGINVAKEL